MKARTGVGLGLIGTGASLQAHQGMPVSNLDWATFALNALMTILGVIFAAKGESPVSPPPQSGRLPR
jgi:hypothetical protein